jgi:3-hydroxybutyrate dehydrogenase
MKKPETFDLQEHKIKKEEILIVKDKYAHAKNVAWVTGAAGGVGRATAVALAVHGLTAVGKGGCSRPKKQ